MKTIKDPDAERRCLISDIEQLYPPDTTKTGEDLLWKTILYDWESLPLPILRTLKQFCISEDHSYERHQFRS